MQDHNAQMAFRLHQKTGEPLAHCSYLLSQTNGDYETALKILERILQQRKDAGQADEPADLGQDEPALTLEQRVDRLEAQLARLTVGLGTMSEQLSLLLDKLSGGDDATR